MYSRFPRRSLGVPLRTLSLAAVVLTSVSLFHGCYFSPAKRLEQRARQYYQAMLYNDYDTLYEYQSAEVKAQIPAHEFIAFMEQEDTKADYGSFEIDSVVIQGDVGKVRLKFKGGFYFFFDDQTNVTSTWVRQQGRWYIQKDPRGKFWKRYIEWMTQQRLLKVPQVGQLLQSVAAAVESFYRTNREYPTQLGQLGAAERFLDPHSDQQPLRYFSDGKTFWIVAANGPDGKADIDVSLYRGNIGEYPPVSLVYDPLTDQGDLFQYGPREKRHW